MNTLESQRGRTAPAGKLDAKLDVDLDAAIEAYEQARGKAARLDLASFLPPADHPRYSEIACELMRVDLEYTWEDGDRKTVESYRPVLSVALDVPAVLERVAFEEYRLRSHAGESVSPADYAARYGIETRQWPVLSPSVRPASFQSESLRSAGVEHPAFTASAAFPPVPGRYLDFELVLELGRGAFARVYLARQSDLAQRFVVLKVSSLFSDEPQRLAQLQHTNIVPIYSVHHVGSLRAVCMPFFGGTTLADLLAPFGHGEKLPVSGREFVSTLIAARQSTLVADLDHDTSNASSTSAPLVASTESETAANNTSRRPPTADPSLLERLERSSYVDAVLLLAEQLTDGLAHAHQRGIIHRDLKPANVLVTDEGRAMLLDFNLAASTESSAAATRSLGGTLAYMPPEILDALASELPPAAADPRADVYAVGVLLFEMLTGRVPHPAENGPLRNIAARLASDRRAKLPSVRSLNPTVPRAIESIVNRCLAVNAADRYPSAEELHEDLLRQRQNLPLRYASEPSLVERGLKWSRRHPRLTSASSVALIASTLLVASLGAWWYRGEEIARRDASTAVAAFHRDVLTWRISLGTHDLDARSLDETLTAVDALLAQHNMGDRADWRGSPAYRRLSSEEQTQFDRDIAEIAYLSAAAWYRKAIGADESERLTSIENAQRLNDLALAAISSLRDNASTHASVSTLPVSLTRQKELLAAALARQPLPLPATGERAVPKSTSDIYLSALDLLDRGEFAAAISLLKTRSESDPQDYALRYALAQAYRGQGDLAAAIDEFAACSALAPQSHLTFFYRGLCRLDRQEDQEAKQDFDEVLTRAPKLPAALLNRAIARERLDDIAGAIEDLSAALASGATETRVYFLRARLLEKQGDRAAAKRDREEGFSRAPRDEPSFIARGVARLPADANAALAEFQAALARYPSSISARRNIAHVLSEHLGRPDDAIAELNVVVEQRPRDAAGRVGRGVLLARLGRRDAAHRDAVAALQASRDGQTVYQAACIYALTSSSAAEDEPHAIKLLAEALLVDPRSARVAATDADMRGISKSTEFRRLLAAAATLDRARSTEVKRP